MTQNDIYKIEKELKVQLSETYKNLLLNHPFEDTIKYSAVCSTLLNNANEVIALNNRLRDAGLQNNKWPNYYYVIGSFSSVEDFYFIDLANHQNDHIYFIDIEERKFNPKNIDTIEIADNFTEFIEEQIHLQNINLANLCKI